MDSNLLGTHLPMESLLQFFAIAFPVLQNFIDEPQASDAILNVLAFIFTGSVAVSDFREPIFGRMDMRMGRMVEHALMFSWGAGNGPSS
jgi:hypothetical protein